MGVLDDLKREADAVRADAERQRVCDAARQAVVVQKVQPCVQALYGYFKDLHAQLRVVSPEVNRDYEVRGFGLLEKLRQGSYKVHTDDDPQRVEQFTFHYECAAEGRREVRINHRAAVADLREYLWANHLRFTTRGGGDGGTVVALEHVVPVSFAFQADYERVGLRLRVRNLECLGASVHAFTIDRIDNEFTDEIAKRILDRPNRYDEIFGNKLTDTSRLRLREMIAERKAQRERDERARRATTGPRKESLTARFSRTFLGRR